MRSWFDRPAERLIADGVHALSDRELLAAVLSGLGDHDTALDLADDLARNYRDLRALALARAEEIATTGRAGEAAAIVLAAAFELGRRGTTVAPPLVVRGPEDVATIARPHLNGRRRERVLVLVCDSANRLLRVVAVSEGTIDRAIVPIREVLNAVLRHDGRAFAIAHNHPSGDAEPSDADRMVTSRLPVAAGVVGLRFLGHVVIAGTNAQSVEVIETQRPR